MILNKIKDKLKYETRRTIEKYIKEPRRAKIESQINSLIKDRSVVMVHIGCGPRVLKDWINLDLSYVPCSTRDLECYGDKYYPKAVRGDEKDFVPIDVTVYGLPFPDNSVDVIFHEDFLEHISQKDQIGFLSEVLRVLKPNGIHRINTPNLIASMRDHSDFSKGMKGIHFGEWSKYKHINVLTPSMLEEMARMVGYSEITLSKRDKSSSPLVPPEYRPGSDRPESDGNIFADLKK